jgi:RimJ/RimL family protein N-acetyltransferase
MNYPTLKTQRLVLRPVRLSDAPAIQRHFNNWNIIKNLSKGVPWPYPADGAEQFLKKDALPRIAKGTSLIWTINLKEAPDEAVGLVDYHGEGERGNRGNWLAQHLQGQGLMTEAIAAVQDYLFFQHGVERMTVLNAKANFASAAVQKKTGCRLIGMTKLAHHSGETDTEEWEVTKESWAAARKGLKP